MTLVLSVASTAWHIQHYLDNGFYPGSKIVLSSAKLLTTFTVHKSACHLIALQKNYLLFFEVTKMQYFHSKLVCVMQNLLHKLFNFKVGWRNLLLMVCCLFGFGFTWSEYEEFLLFSIEAKMLFCDHKRYLPLKFISFFSSFSLRTL